MLNILFQNPTPDTVGAMLLGYGLMAVVTVVYVGTLFLRRRNLLKDIAVMESLDD